MPVDGHCGRGVFHDDVGSSPAGGSASSKQGKSCGDQASEAVLNGIHTSSDMGRWKGGEAA